MRAPPTADRTRSSDTNHFVASPTLRPSVVRIEAQLHDFSFPNHAHDHLCVGLVHAGAYTSRYGLRRYRVGRGDVVLVNPGETHDGRPAGAHGRGYTMLEIDPLAYRALCVAAVGRNWIDLPNAVLRQPLLRTALQVWLKTLSADDPAAEQESAIVVLGHLATAKHGALLSARASSALARRVQQVLRDELGHEGAIGALATALGASRFSLIRAFKSTYGLTPEDFRRQLKVQRARAGLRGTEALAGIAARAGFADQSHMTREFLRFTGLTPGRYRRALGGAAAANRR
jgi:AraC-like DNA-binding protein